MRIEFDQRKMGLAIVALSFVVFIVNLMLTQTILGLRLELHKSCPLPPDACPYKSSIPIESVGGFMIAIAVGVSGLFLIFTQGSGERAVQTGIQTRKLKQKIKSLDREEKAIYDILVRSDGSAFQSDLVKETGSSKVKTSRILDKLETKGILERRRRGMANIVVLKE